MEPDTEPRQRRGEWSARFELSQPAPGVALVTINRPEKLNAMDRQFFSGLSALMAELGEQAAGPAPTRAVVLTGAGRAFSAGGDIDMFHDLAGQVAQVRAHLRRVYDAFHSVERCPVPVIAAVNGLAFGGGTELALACDVVLAGTSARFSFKEVSVGLSPGYGIVRAPQAIGRGWTRYLALSGRELDPDQAQRIGLVQEVHPDEDLLPAAVQLAAEIAANPPLAVAVGKAFLNRDTHGGFDESVEAITLLFGSDDHARLVDRFRRR